jgi:hypothetical protein
MKFIVKTAKPRNPFVAASLRRMAGAHRSSASTSRQQGQQALRRELTQAADRYRHSP